MHSVLTTVKAISPFVRLMRVDLKPGLAVTDMRFFLLP